MRLRFKGHFEGAVEEIRFVLQSIQLRLLPPREGSRDHYVHPDDQNTVLERVFVAFSIGGHLQSIQTNVVEAAVQRRNILRVRAQVDCVSGTPTWTTPPSSQVSQRCCDAPEGITCRATGNPHVRIAVCAICHLPIDPKQPFCGEQVGGLLCEALLRAPPTASPFTTVDTSTARRPREPTPPTEGDLPASKVLKF